MRRKALLFFFLLPFLKTWSQNPATIFTIPNRTIVLPCGTNCTSISVTVPHIKETSTYVVTTSPYLPFAYATPTGTVAIPNYIDDRWSPVINIGFPFCFYGTTYPSLLVGSNSNITFDVSRANTGSGYSISNPIPSTSYAPSSIFGPYHDIDPQLAVQPADRKIEYRVEGVAPKRRFIASYNDLPYYSDNCSQYHATHEMVLYESTGVIEVYMKDNPSCSEWNSGLAILGVQNQNSTQAVAAPGKNATVWGSMGMNEAYRFTPFGGTPKFKKAELLINGFTVAVGDTASGTPGNLNLNFPNVCPVTDSTAYVVRVTYGSCADPSQDVSFDDTVYVKKSFAPVLTLATQNATCSTGGTITANVAGGGAYQYSLNNGTPQASNVFSNLSAGTYTVSVSNGTCSASSQATISLVNNLTVTALPLDTSFCTGASFTPRVTTNGTPSYSWSPSAGLSSSTVAQPLITASQNTSYTLTATEGSCQATAVIRVTVFPGAQVSAGPDQVIIAGDRVQLLASGSQGAYLWTPSSGLSATNVLQPVASPTQTQSYNLKVTTSQGCTASDDVLVTVVPYCVKPMEAFTPNGDGINDVWLVTNGNCLKTAKAEVFNRYGNRVFQSDDYKNDWNGTFKGSPLPDGTYYFVITYQLINGKLVYLKGNVTILR
jgi:gliding motility-associated-like protein